VIGAGMWTSIGLSDADNDPHERGASSGGR
jgi:hypothetical protein